MQSPLALSIAIPSYRREAVLVATVEYLLALQPRAAEIMLLDQTREHTVETEARLRRFSDDGLIRWIRLPEPSITAAMNQALRLARQEIVLFVDDDIRPEPQLLAAHLRAHARFADGLVAGRVIQPWQEGQPDGSHEGFASEAAGVVGEFIGCNFSVRRELAIALGGFDENFVRVAYRYEAEFAHRYRATGRQIHFEPQACLHHLKDGSGGTRSFGDHLTTWRPDHAVGAYYHGLRTGTWAQFFARPARAVATRYHLRHPWAIPGTLLAELWGMLWALALFARGPRHIDRMSRQDSI